jgi:hypothetical protein
VRASFVVMPETRSSSRVWTSFDLQPRETSLALPELRFALAELRQPTVGFLLLLAGTRLDADDLGSRVLHLLVDFRPQADCELPGLHLSLPPDRLGVARRVGEDAITLLPGGLQTVGEQDAGNHVRTRGPGGEADQDPND